MEQLLCHFIGDYWLQNDWMALNKKNNFGIALLHSAIYTLPFLFLTRNVFALLIICITHAIIDGTNIVNRLNQIKNNDYSEAVIQEDSVEKVFNYGNNAHITLSDLSNTIYLSDGYSRRPFCIRVFLIIVQDNILHLLINFLALKYFV